MESLTSTVDLSEDRKAVETMLLYCVPCNEEFYSPTSSQITMTNLDFEYYSNSSCEPCPYGALCKNEIKSKANFWGEIYNQRLFMYLCPEGYCCQNLTCDTYNQCANNRAGKLCGRCEDGYSEALFSTQCIKNEDSTYAYTFWVIIALYGFLYVLFFGFRRRMADVVIKYCYVVKTQDTYISC